MAVTSVITRTEPPYKYQLLFHPAFTHLNQLQWTGTNLWLTLLSSFISFCSLGVEKKSSLSPGPRQMLIEKCEHGRMTETDWSFSWTVPLTAGHGQRMSQFWSRMCVHARMCGYVCMCVGRVAQVSVNERERERETQTAAVWGIISE